MYAAETIRYNPAMGGKSFLDGCDMVGHGDFKGFADLKLGGLVFEELAVDGDGFVGIDGVGDGDAEGSNVAVRRRGNVREVFFQLSDFSSSRENGGYGTLDGRDRDNHGLNNFGAFEDGGEWHFGQEDAFFGPDAGI